MSEPDDQTRRTQRQLMGVDVRCPGCGATHCRPEYVDPEDPPETLQNTCIAPHPARGADFSGCGEDVELEVIEVREH